MTESLPLEGIKVLDLSRLLPGPYCTMMLADLGCEVIKVEEPVKGDYYRKLVPDAFKGLNRDKQSISVNFTNPEEKMNFLELVKRSDILLESFRPGVVKKLGIEYEELAKVNKRLIYVSLTGYGQEGPYANFPGHDINYFGAAGLLGFCGTEKQKYDIPSYMTLVDLNAGVFCLTSILTALIHRDKIGTGQYIDVSITDCAISWLARYMNNDETKNKEEKQNTPGYGIFETADGRFITLACLEEKFWNGLSMALGPDFCERVEGVDKKDINKLIQLKIGENELEHWQEVFTENDIPYGMVNNLEDLEHDPQLKTRDLIFSDNDGNKYVRFPIKFSKIKYKSNHQKAPCLGEHNDKYLGQFRKA